MRFIPILFSTAMVQAILSGDKTITRRVMKPQPTDDDIKMIKNWDDETIPTLKYKVGDFLWVRETWRWIEQETGGYRYEYKATEKINLSVKWRPSIYMPRAALRLFLKVTNIRVERLQEITEQDALNEGIVDYKDGTYKNYYRKKGLTDQDGVECLGPIASFQSLWQTINGFESWDNNPFVLVITFKVIRYEISK